MNRTIKFLLNNATGLRTKYDNVISYMKKNEIDMSLVTETWLKSNSTLTNKLICPSICQIETERGMAGTGIIFDQQRSKISVNSITRDNTNGRYSIVAMGSLLIVVTYLSPSMSLESTREVLENIFSILEMHPEKAVIFTGDFNCKHPILGSMSMCQRGNFVINLFNRKGYKLANQISKDQCTNVTPGCQPSIIDLV